MKTLDERREQFRANAAASIRVTKDGRGYVVTPTNDQLAIQLGLAEATALHIRDFLNPQLYAPQVLGKEFANHIRAVIVAPTPEHLRGLAEAIDGLFDWLIMLQGRLQSSTLAVDATSAMGWVGKAALFVRANDMYRANDAGRNALDAITRVMILTGHSRDDLEALQLSLGNPKP